MDILHSRRLCVSTCSFNLSISSCYFRLLILIFFIFSSNTCLEISKSNGLSWGTSSIGSLSIIDGVIKFWDLQTFHTAYSIVTLLPTKPVLILKVYFQDFTIQSISFNVMESSYENSNSQYKLPSFELSHHHRNA